ncbi:MAG TPA: hypothetical protein VF862_08750 [Gemmatimonadales bacterium]
MSAPRPTPYELAIAPWADERFLPVRQALGELGVDPWDRDAFLMAKPVVELVHALRPEAGVGEGMDEFVALLHAAFLYWMHGEPLRRLEEEDFVGLLGTGGRPDRPPLRAGEDEATGGRPGLGYDAAGAAHQAARRVSSIEYVQFPPLRIWGAPGEGAAHEPLDGCFLVRRGGRLAVVGILGAHPGRDGFTVVAVEGARPGELSRPDGTPLFGPVMEGGSEAGLHSLTGMEELLELGWRAAGMGRGT